jgi:hypothetical protein
LDSRVSLVIDSFEFALRRMDGFWLVVEAAVSPTSSFFGRVLDFMRVGGRIQ